MWRVTEDKKEAQAKTHEALRGATGSGNVTVGPGGLGTINIGNTGTVGAGTINVGIGATNVNIGTNRGDVVLGNTGGSVFTKSINNYFGNTGIGTTWIYNTLNLVTPITLGSASNVTTVSGATGTSSTNTLGFGIRINNTGFTITNYNQNNSVASILLSYDGVYLATWCVQVQITTAPTAIFSNLAYNNVSATTTTGFLGFANWGMTRVGSILYGTSGSTTFQGVAGNFCNIVINIDGGSGYSSPAVTYTLTRLG